VARSILVPIDFSDVTGAVTAEARGLAEALGAGIRLIHVTRPQHEFVGAETVPERAGDVFAAKLADERRKLREHEEATRSQGFDVTSKLLIGRPADEIIEEARAVKPALIILGSHGHGALHHLVTGSTCEAVLKRTAWPVVIVPSRAAGTAL